MCSHVCLFKRRETRNTLCNSYFVYIAYYLFLQIIKIFENYDYYSDICSHCFNFNGLILTWILSEKAAFHEIFYSNSSIRLPRKSWIKTYTLIFKISQRKDREFYILLGFMHMLTKKKKCKLHFYSFKWLIILHFALQRFFINVYLL